MTETTAQAQTKAADKTAAKSPAQPKAKPETAAASFINEDAFKSVETFTAAAREQFETAIAAFTGNTEEWREKTEDLTDEMRDRFEKTQKRVADVNAELVEAAQAEVSDAVQFANDLAKARTFADALEIQQGYFAKMFETRMERVRELTEVSVDVARDSMTPVNADFSAFFATPKTFEDFFPFPVKA